MGKRSSGFRRHKNDAYDTPEEAVAPLIGHLRPGVRYIEPMAGRGDLVRALAPHAECVVAGDLEPRAEGIYRIDARQITPEDAASTGAEMFITNPPWTRPILHDIIETLSDALPTWLLFDADWIHTKQAGRYLWRMRRVVSVGRVRWIEGSPHSGKDNCAWHLFDARGTGPAEFFGRRA